MISVNSIIQKAKKNIPELDTEKIRKAYEYAMQKQSETVRMSGDPHIFHSLSVADILVDFSHDENIILAALLHNIPEDQDTIFEEITTLFGKEVSLLVKGVASLSHIRMTKNEWQLDSLRNMFLAMAKDIRVVIIKLADRLHNMRTLEFLEHEQQKEMAYETLYIYAPIASRLGMFALKSPLEDLSFYYLYRNDHKKLSRQMGKHELYRDRIIRQAQNAISNLMTKNGIDGFVKGRVKHLYSIHQKLQKKNKDSIDDIFDIFAMRIIVPTISDCYFMLGIIHEHFVPLPHQFKDYIAVPKPNGYRSLHTTVLGLAQETKKTLPIEIQIRTQEMEEEAEFGIAAHWSYKEKGVAEKVKKIDQPKEWIESLLEMEQRLKNNQEFAQNVSKNSFSDRIYAITPGGEIKNLPYGATPIDFAFAVHSDIGLRMRFAKANGKLVPLDYKIQNGDAIEIVVSRDGRPNQNWISLCVSSKAKAKLRTYFYEKDADTLLREGKDALNRQLVRSGLSELDQSLSVLKEYGKKVRNKKGREEILLRIGNGSITASAIVRDILRRTSPEKIQPTKKTSRKKGLSTPEKTKEVGIIIGENRDIPTKMALCCKPKQGDKIIGFVTRGNHITIHKTDCKTLSKLDSRRFLPARYETDDSFQEIVLHVRQKGDRVGFTRDVLSVLANSLINVTNISFENRSSASTDILFTIEMGGSAELEEVIADVKRVEGVENVRMKGE